MKVWSWNGEAKTERNAERIAISTEQKTKKGEMCLRRSGGRRGPYKKGTAPLNPEGMEREKGAKTFENHNKTADLTRRKKAEGCRAPPIA